MKKFKVLSIDALADGQDLDHIEVSTWFERDNAQVIATDTIDDKELFKLVTPEGINQFIEDGFKKQNEPWDKAIKRYLRDHDMTGDHGINWSWNNWHRVNIYDESEHGPLTMENAEKYFKEHILITSESMSDFEIDDDQYNYVLVRKANGCPIIAIEYGSQET